MNPDSYISSFKQIASDTYSFLSNGNSLIYPGLPNEYTQYSNIKEYMKYFDPNTVSNEMNWFNSHGLRSDEFSPEHDGLHVVYAGCSFTFGEAMPVSHTWPKRLHNLLSNNIKLSGFYNIGFPGASITQVVNQIIAYSKEFAIPDVLFVNLPDIGRERLVQDSPFDKKTPYSTIHEIPSDRLAVDNIRHGINALVFFASSLGVKLFVGSWASSHERDISLRDKFGDPLAILRTQMVQFNEDVDFLIQKFPETVIIEEDAGRKDLLARGLDGGHPGTLIHMEYADIFYKAFMEDRYVV